MTRTALGILVGLLASGVLTCLGGCAASYTHWCTEKHLLRFQNDTDQVVDVEIVNQAPRGVKRKVLSIEPGTTVEHRMYDTLCGHMPGARLRLRNSGEVAASVRLGGGYRKLQDASDHPHEFGIVSERGAILLVPMRAYGHDATRPVEPAVQREAADRGDISPEQRGVGVELMAMALRARDPTVACGTTLATGGYVWSVSARLENRTDQRVEIASWELRAQLQQVRLVDGVGARWVVIPGESAPSMTREQIEEAIVLEPRSSKTVSVPSVPGSGLVRVVRGYTAAADVEDMPATLSWQLDGVVHRPVRRSEFRETPGDHVDDLEAVQAALSEHHRLRGAGVRVTGQGVLVVERP